MTRVSERMRYATVEKRVNESKQQNADAMERLSSQKEIRKLSDDPIGAAQIIRHRDGILDNKQYQKNIEFSKGFLERSEAALQSITDSLIRAKELAIGMANDTYDAQSRQATAREIKEIMDEVVQLGNTTFNGRYLFAGFRSQTPPLSVDGDYLGDDGSVFVQVSPGDFRQMNMSGRYLFEASADDRARGHYNLMHALDVLRSGMEASDKGAIHSAITELDYQLDKTTSHHATLGALWNSLENTNDRLGSEEVLMRGRLSKIQDTDIYDASSEFRRTEVVLQGTLLASNKLLQPSLLNFLQ
jgi:flagellar hook-associated protein 3 FlgL